jgi:hypothetical protein
MVGFGRQVDWKVTLWRVARRRRTSAVESQKGELESAVSVNGCLRLLPWRIWKFLKCDQLPLLSTYRSRSSQDFLHIRPRISDPVSLFIEFISARCFALSHRYLRESPSM